MSGFLGLGGSSAAADPNVVGDMIGSQFQGFACDYLPFMYKTPYCAIPTVQQIASDTSNFGPALSPESQQQIQEDTLSTLQDFMAANPAETVAYNQALQIQAANPLTNLLTGNTPGVSLTDPTTWPWYWWATIGVLGVAGFTWAKRR